MGNDESRRTSTQRVELPEWLSNASQNAIAHAQTFFNTPYQPYTGERVAGLSADTLAAQARLRAPQERIVDETGRLGSIANYMNPYTDQVLQPQLRNMNNAFLQEGNRIGNLRHQSGAYGDARHGVREAMLAQDYTTAVGDVTGRTYSDAFNTAMGLRGSDLSRFFQGDNALMASGMLTQQTEQNRRDADYEAYLNQQGDAYNRLAALIGATGGVPYGQTQTNVGARGYPFLQAIGSIFGALAGNSGIFGGGG